MLNYLGQLPDIKGELKKIDSKLTSTYIKLNAKLHNVMYGAIDQLKELQTGLTELFKEYDKQYKVSNEKIIKDFINELYKDLEKYNLETDKIFNAIKFFPIIYKKEIENILPKLHLHYTTGEPVKYHIFGFLGALPVIPVLLSILKSYIYNLIMDLPQVRNFITDTIANIYMFAVELLDPEIKSIRNNVLAKAENVQDFAESIESQVTEYMNLLEKTVNSLEYKITAFSTQNYVPTESKETLPSKMSVTTGRTEMPELIYQDEKFMPVPADYPYTISIEPQRSIDEHGRVILSYKQVPREIPVSELLQLGMGIYRG